MGGVFSPVELRFAAMRNPFRLKNLRLRFLPLYLAGCALLLVVRPEPVAWCIGLVGILAGALLRSWGAGHLVKGDRMTVPLRIRSRLKAMAEVRIDVETSPNLEIVDLPRKLIDVKPGDVFAIPVIFRN